MPSLTHTLAFAALALGMVLTPGPNMIYLVSRSICQGRAAGLISLAGIGLGLCVYMLCAAFGISALLLAVPFAYDALRFGGAIYLAWLGWQAVRPGGRSPFQVRDLPADSPRKLFGMGLFTALLNPKLAMLCLALLPQFIQPERGAVLGQTLILGSVQILTSLTVNSLIVIAAGSIAAFLAERPTWVKVQRWVMGGVLGGMALRLAFDARR